MSGAVWAAGLRYSERPMSAGTRLFGVSGSALLVLLLIMAGLFRWQSHQAQPTSATLNVFNVAPPAAPPEPASEIPPGPPQIRRERPQPKVDAPTMPPPLVPVPGTSHTSPPAPALVTDPGPPVERTTAPPSSPLPPASRAGDARPTWEGQVLAALNAAKRYPREARRNRQQGMPWLRFVIDREGRVRTVRLERSSGFDPLDREALALPLRAQPLPKPPANIGGDRIELVVPVEFFIG